MAQGTRGRWVRVAAAGLGVLVCSGLVGCTGLDKDKDKSKPLTKAPTPGLPGTPMIGANGTASRTPAPYGSSGIQQTGGFGQQRVGSTGMNTLNTSVPPQNYGGPNAYNPPTTIGAPGLPGITPSVQPGASNFQPTGGTGGTAPGSWSGRNTDPLVPTNTVAGASPLPPSLTDGPLPPPPPGSLTSANMPPVQPPASAFPIPPQPPLPPPGVNAFGGQ